MRLSSLVVLLSFCSILHADKAPPSPQILQKCPPPASLYEDVAFEVFGSWLYLQPNGTNLYYAAEAFPYDMSIPGHEAASPNWQIFEIDPGFHSGFDVGMKFLLTKPELGIALDWERLHAEDKNSMNVTPLSFGTGNMVGPIYDIGPNSDSYKSAKGKGIFKLDEVNLLIEKSLCFIPNFTLGLDLGVSFARIEQGISSFYSNPGESITRTFDTVSTYWGIGPQFRFGIDYRIYPGLYFTGSAASSMYLGRIKNTANYQSYTPGMAAIGVIPNTQETTIPHRTQLIPGFEEKLGFAYTRSFKNSSLNLWAGYQFQIFLNAVQSMDMLTQAAAGDDPSALPTEALFALTFNRTLSNFMLSGPYISIDVGF